MSNSHPPLPYRLLDHTADLYVEIYGRDLPELFSNAALMLFDTMLELQKVREVIQEEVEINSPDLEELFLDWLRELLYRFATRGFVITRAEITALDPQRAQLRAKIHGETYDPQRHGLKIEIKTPTYHHFAIERTTLPDNTPGYTARLVFDV